MGRLLHDYRQEVQKQTEWCWAAVACSVASYPNGSNFTQCGVASAVLQSPNCCPRPSACNTMHSLGAALKVTGSLAIHVPSQIQLDAIRSEIDERRPVCFRIGRTDGTGHVAAIVGYGDDPEERCPLAIRDPWYEPSLVPYGVLREFGYLEGAWTDTYLTT
jgi:hypothetical protein